MSDENIHMADVNTSNSNDLPPKRKAGRPRKFPLRVPKKQDDAKPVKIIRKLTLDQKVYIVKGFARHRTPQQIADDFEEEYAMPIARSHVEQYHPNYMVKATASYKDENGKRKIYKRFGEYRVERGTRPDIGETWQDVFAKERRLFHESPHEIIPIAIRGGRLEHADRAARRLAKIGDYDNLKDYLTYAAKEMGGAFGNGNGNVNVSVNQQQAQSQGNAVLQSEDYNRAMAELAEKLARRPDVMLALLPSDVQEKVIEIARGVGAESGQAVQSTDDDKGDNK